MAVTFNVPSSPSKSVLTVNEFLGVDFTNSPTTVDIKKSPNAVNMIRDVPGKVRKSMGWKTVETYDGKINGCHYLRGAESWLTHAGTKLYFQGKPIYYDLADERSRSWQFKDGMYLIDGKRIIQVAPEYFEEVQEGFLPIRVAHYEKPFKTKALEEFKIYGSTKEFSSVGSLDDPVEFEHSDSFVIYMSWGDSPETAGTEGYLLEVPLKGIRCEEDQANNREPASYLYYFSDELDIVNKKLIFHLGETSLDTSSGWTKTTVNGKTVYSHTIPSDMENCTSAADTPVLWCDSARVWSYSNLGMVGDGAADFCQITVYNGKLYYYPVGLSHAFTDVQYTMRLLYKSKSPQSIDLSTSSVYEELLGQIEAIKYPDKDEFQIGNVQGKVRYKAEHVVDRYIAQPVEKVAYIPTLTISKDPNGGGEQYEDLNLLQPGFTETFLGQADVKEYCMSFGGLDPTAVKVELMNADGDFVEVSEGTDFTVDRETGIITFVTAPGESPMRGEDNVKITAYRTVEGYADRINHCTIGTLFGVNGALDRLFLSGNEEYRNHDWFSAQYDPTYFADTSYSVLGSDVSAIVGYSIISNLLAAHKDSYEKDQNIILRQGDLEENKPTFRIANTLQGAGAIAKDSFAYLSTEPLFLTQSGIFAVTAQDVTGEKYAQNRSFFLNGKLLEEENLKDAFGFVYKDMYWLCINGVAYILDGLQPLQTDRAAPYSTRQYAGFYRTNMPVNSMWERDNALWFGTKDGRVCRFATDKYDLKSYNDDGNPIEAVWETPDIDGDLFYKNKTARYLALRLDSAIYTSVSVWGMKRGLWNFIKRDSTSATYLSFPDIDFSKFSFRTDTTAATIPFKVRLKKVDKFRFRLVNDALNEPFGLFDIGIEFVENGNYKR
ncbi:MAG: hypothetical protein J6A08_02620 [Lachnospiraceae bacterium]|nr:hypothetical protein [Lachnospiraceae bacterium]